MANFFNDDTRCKALWRFENCALTADSKGTNTLTAVATPVADLADFREGAACADIEYADGDYFTIADAALDAGFPLKSGDVTKKLTWCAWIKQESQTASYGFILSKFNSVSNKRSLSVATVSNALVIYWSYDGVNSETINTGIAIANGEWYHVAVAIDGVAKTISVRVYKLSTTTVYTYSNNQTNVLYITDAAFRIGARDGDTTYRWDGRIDEVVIFNDLLTATEIDKIRNGTFGVYVGQVPLAFTPQAETYGTHAYVGQISLTLTPQATCGGPHTPYVGAQLLRFIPVADYEPVGAGTSTVIPASTGGWAMGGAGVIVSTTPSATVIPAIDVATGLPFVSETGLVFGGGTTEVGIAEVTTTYPQADVIVAEEIGFVFCGPEVTGNAATTFPASDVIVAPAAFEFGGAGVITQVAAADIPSVVLIGTGGFVLSGSGFPLDPAVTPTATVITPTGGWRLGGLRPDPVEVTYPDDLDRVIIGSGGFEFGGDEVGALATYPSSTVIASLGAFFLLSGAGLCTSKMPLSTAIVTGEGGFVLAGATPAEVFEAFVLSGMAFEPSVFSGFNFNSFCEKGGVAYAAGDAGIYLLGGDHDAGEPIRSGVRIGPLNAGSDGTKRVRSVQFGQGGKDTSIRVTTDGGESGVFVSERDDSRAVISRNIQGQEFTVDVMEFAELSQFEMAVLHLARR